MNDSEEEISSVEQESFVPVAVEQSRPSRRRFFILEPPVFLLYYAWNVSTAVLTDQIVYQACTVSLGIDQSQCALLGKEHESPEVQELEARVQPYTANILMVEALANSILPAVLNLFIGPWSDRFGRKPVLMVTFTGCLLSYALTMVICWLSSHYSVDPWLYAIAFVPLAVTGSFCTLMTTTYCYVADVTDEHERGAKMTMLEVALYGGMLLGSLTSSFILRMSNATTVFVVATGASFLSVLYIGIGVKESIPVNEHRHTLCCAQLRYLIRPRLVYDTFQTSFSNRPNFDRAIILVGVVVLGANLFALEDTHTVFFLFVRKQFNWAVRKYSFYSSAEIVFMIMGNFLGTYGLQKMLGLTEAGIAAVGYFCCILNSIAIAVAFKPWHLYLATVVCMLKGVADPMTRAFISNSAPPTDFGRIFSFTSTFEALMPLGAAPLYTFVYKNTLAQNPGAFSWISAGVYAICYCLSMFVCILQSTHRAIIYSRHD